MNAKEPDVIRFGSDGLIPAVAQDIDTGDVLMLAFMNEEALALTRSTGLAHYWSRGREKLWRKGESSGNVQVVHAILVNCEQNSLLLRVSQRGAVCHTGYPTCYFRSLDEDGSLTIVRERAFDPESVYGPSGESNALQEATRLQFGAYCFLRDNDLEGVSSTSRRLRQPEEHVCARAAEELIELAGVLDGEHRHGDLASDVRLEASQVIYWVLVEAIRSGATWERLRPDRALATVDETVAAATVAKLLRGEACIWRRSGPDDLDLVSAAHATLALVGQACHAAGVDPLKPVLMDLDDLRSRPYLAAYFAGAAA